MAAKPVQVSIDTELLRAYAGQADALLEEIAELLDAQAWPSGAASALW